MKRYLWLLIIVLLLCTSAAFAEPLGFGFVNAKDVALRREPGGKVVVRVPQDACVWISDSKADKKGQLWYRLNTGLNIDHANYDCEGWMKAEFVDCGRALWHDVTAISCSPFGNGLMARFSDGSAVTASRPVVSADGTAWVSSRRMTDGYAPVRQVLTSMGLNFYALDGAGRLYAKWKEADASITERFRLIGGANGLVVGVTRDGRLASMRTVDLSDFTWIVPDEPPKSDVLSQVEQICFSWDWLLMRTAQGEVLAAHYGQRARPEEFPDWTTWTGLLSLDSGFWCLPDQRTIRGSVFAGVKRDGTVLIYPAELQTAASDWQGMTDVKIGQHFLLGLKHDGTAVTVSTDGRAAPDVSGWQEVTAIQASETYCVGLKRDGTLVFAGDVTLMGEGHTRR